MDYFFLYHNVEMQSGKFMANIKINRDNEYSILLCEKHNSANPTQIYFEDGIKDFNLVKAKIETLIKYLDQNY